MKNISFFISSFILSILICGCNPDEETTTPVEIPMSFNINLDGVNYTYSENYIVGASNAGSSSGILGGGLLTLVLHKPSTGGFIPFAVNFSISMNSPQVGSFPCSLSLTKNINSNILDPSNINASSNEVPINITEFGNESYQVNPDKNNFSK
jgi:hypothetical protein